MKLEVRKSFEKDIEKITDPGLARKLSALLDALELCDSLSSIQHVKKIKGPGNYYRIRLGQYRLGLKNNGSELILLRFMHRKDIYTYFP